MLTTDPASRKATPIYSGVLNYFPLALAEVAKCSKAGNDQHNPGKPLHWDKTKSTDHADSLVRHLLEHGTEDTDGVRHSAKVAWRALALLQIELEKELEHGKDVGEEVFSGMARSLESGNELYANGLSTSISCDRVSSDTALSARPDIAQSTTFTGWSLNDAMRAWGYTGEQKNGTS